MLRPRSRSRLPSLVGVPTVTLALLVVGVIGATSRPVTVWAATTYSVTGVLRMHAPLTVAVDTNDHTIYGVDSAGSTVSIFRGGVLRATASIGADAVAIAVDSTTHTAYVANSGSGDVTIIRGDVVVGRVGVGTAPTRWRSTRRPGSPMSPTS